MAVLYRFVDVRGHRSLSLPVLRIRELQPFKRCVPREDMRVLPAHPHRAALRDVRKKSLQLFLCQILLKREFFLRLELIVGQPAQHSRLILADHSGIT